MALISPIWTANAGAAGPEMLGSWSAVGNWPLIAIHAALTPEGKVFTFGTNGDGKQTGAFIYDIWDPTAGAITQGHSTLPNTTPTDLFCSIQILAPETGNILTLGGDITGPNGGSINIGNDDIVSLNTAGNSLSPAGSLNRDRWYASVATLPSGGLYIQGGDGGADRPEVRMPNGTSNISSIDTTTSSWYYPRNFVIPDGRIFGYTINNEMYYISQDLTTKSQAGAGYIPLTPGYTDGIVHYAPGKLLALGGYNTTAAVTIDLTGAQPVIEPAGNKSSLRIWANGTVLPDGKVLVTGGSDGYNTAVNVNNSAEIWDPATRQFSVLASAQRPRLYHATSLLLPDGRVLIAGGGAPGPTNEINAEIYSPPYLFNAAGTPAARPTIVSAPTIASPGTTLDLSLGSSATASRVTLVKTGSVTHSLDVDQRYMPLTFTQSGTSVSAALPSNSAVLTPGAYMVYVFDANGVPSVARIFRVLPTPTAGPYGGLTGGPLGTLFADEAASAATVTGVDIRSGAGITGLQVQTSIGSLPARGGAGDTLSTIALQPGEKLVGMSGTTGVNSTSVTSMTLRTSANRTFGPFGTVGGTAV